MKNKIISMILIFSFVFGFTSCKKNEEIPPKDHNLIIEKEEIIYTSEDVEAAAQNFADLVAELAPMLGYPSLKDEKKNELAEMFKQDIMPILLNAQIHKDELSEMFKIADDSLDVLNDEHNVDLKLEVISTLYTRFSAAIDAARLGCVIYELQLFWLETSLENARERYDKYGYPFYLDDIERYTALIEEAKTIEDKDFAEAISVIMFAVSASLGSVKADVGVIKISVNDVFDILKLQGEKFAMLTINDEEWSAIVNLCEEFIPDSADTLKGKLFVALGEDNFFSDAALLMPDALEFYTAVTGDLSPDSISILEEDEAYARERVICNELIRNKDSFVGLLRAMESKIPSVTDSQINLINSYDKEGYAAFVQSYYATSEELIVGIEAFSEFPTEDNYGALKDLIYGYAASLNPVVAYVYLYL